MTIDEALKTLTPETGAALIIATKDMDQHGVPYFISEAGRDLLTQCLYGLQGRLGEGETAIPFESLVAACKQAGIRPPGKEIITKTLQSNHFNGTAVDIYPLKDSKVDWNNQDERIVAAMKAAGFIWGGDWEWKDPPHFERRK